MLPTSACPRIGRKTKTVQLNIAPTGSLLFITIVHVGAVSGTQLDDQPANVEPAAGVAVSVTLVPTTKFDVQPAPEAEVQLIAGGSLTTEPVPNPTVYTVSAGNTTPPPLSPNPIVPLPATSAPLTDVPMAVMVVVPWPFSIARPAELTVAILTSLDFHVTWLVRSWVLGSVLNVPIAINCEGSPTVPNVWLDGITAIETKS